MSVDDFAFRVFLLCRLFDLSVTSWVRTEARNKAVGGASRSWHLRGLAVDVVPDEWVVCDELRAAAARIGLRAMREADHVHLEPAGPREPGGPGAA